MKFSGLVLNSDVSEFVMKLIPELQVLSSYRSVETETKDGQFELPLKSPLRSRYKYNPSESP